jgi:hypothetical protein
MAGQKLNTPILFYFKIILQKLAHQIKIFNLHFLLQSEHIYSVLLPNTYLFYTLYYATCFTVA